MKKIMVLVFLALFLFAVVASAELKVVAALYYFGYGENSAVVPLEGLSYLIEGAGYEKIVATVKEQKAKGEILQKLSREGWKIVHIEVIKGDATHAIITLQK